jgi:hypothetical protein
MDLFKKYGEVKRVFNLIDKRGMAFITYVTPPPTHPQSSLPPMGGMSHEEREFVPHSTSRRE